MKEIQMMAVRDLTESELESVSGGIEWSKVFAVVGDIAVNGAGSALGHYVAGWIAGSITGSGNVYSM